MSIWALRWCDSTSVKVIGFTHTAEAAQAYLRQQGKVLAWHPRIGGEVYAIFDDGYYSIVPLPLLDRDQYQTIEGTVERQGDQFGGAVLGVFSDDDPNGASVLCLNDILRPLEWKRVRVTVEVVDG